MVLLVWKQNGEEKKKTNKQMLIRCQMQIGKAYKAMNITHFDCGWCGSWTWPLRDCVCFVASKEKIPIVSI